MEPHDKTALCKEGGFIVGRLIRETLIKFDSEI